MSRFVYSLVAVLTIFIFSAQPLSAVLCGGNGSYVQDPGTGVYTVTDCWCKNPCITWNTMDENLIDTWCNNAANEPICP